VTGRSLVASLAALTTLALAYTSTEPATSSPTSLPATSAPSGQADPPPSSTTSPATTSTTMPMSTEPFGLSRLDREELLATWAEDRAAAVARITSAGWGVDELGMLRGPGGLTVDLSGCPGGWSDSGPPGTPIELRWWTAMHHGPGSESMQAYLDWLGEEASAAGRPIRLTTDFFEAYDPQLAATELQQADLQAANRRHLDELTSEVHAVVGFRLWDQNRTFASLIEGACLPTLAPTTFVDGDRGPWFGPAAVLQPADEARAWALHAATTHGAGRVAVIVMDNYWGDGLLDPLLTAAEALGERESWGGGGGGAAGRAPAPAGGGWGWVGGWGGAGRPPTPQLPASTTSWPRS
jgi:hypothetical protein